MTWKKVFCDELDDDTLALVNGLGAQLDRRLERNLLRQAYYDSKRMVRQVTSVVPPQYSRLALSLGWAAKAVDGLANRINLDGFTLPGEDLDTLGFGTFADDNYLFSEVKGAVVNALLFGPAFIVNSVGAAGEAGSLVHFRSANDATGQWDSRARRMKNLLSITDRDNDGAPVGFVLHLEGESLTCVRDGGVWVLAETWQHGYGLPVERMAFRPWVRDFGRSRITRPVMAIQDSAMRALMRLEGHMDTYSFPEMWMLGADSSIFKRADGSMKASWDIMLGRIKGIPDDPNSNYPRADVKQFQATDPDSHLKQLNALAKLMARETALPDSDFALSDYSNPTSADSYVQGREELIAEAETATDEFGVGLSRAVRRGLAIAHDDPGVFGRMAGLEARWRSPLHLSRAAQADAGMKQLSAVPWLAETPTGLELLGLSDQQIRAALAERRISEGRSLLEKLGGANAGGIGNGAVEAAPSSGGDARSDRAAGGAPTR